MKEKEVINSEIENLKKEVERYRKWYFAQVEETERLKKFINTIKEQIEILK